MKKLVLLAAAIALGMPNAVVAHPTDVAYQTRGECEAAYAAASKFDRDRLVSLHVFDSKGAAQRTFNELFECQYDEDEQAWFIVLIGGPS
jgi:hypothetical protein